MQEIWKVYHNGKFVKYEVSNLGNVKKNNNPYKCRINKKSKYYCFGRYFLHRALAELFISNPENKPCVDHIDGNRQNNKLENLRWATYKENSNTELALSNMSKAQKSRNINHHGDNNPKRKAYLKKILENNNYA